MDVISADLMERLGAVARAIEELPTLANVWQALADIVRSLLTR